ncbi:hypothetical protein M0R72_16565 [Candidatus Pacearchaeota archaeon]|nr:hypothetical protein [Candidatus Pacearchaeota archaeon]
MTDSRDPPGYFSFFVNIGPKPISLDSAILEEDMDGCNMNFVNKLGEVIGLFVLAMCIIAPNVSSTDYSLMEKTSENILSDSQYNLGIIAPSVSITPYQVAVNYIGASGTTEAIMKDVGSIIGVYWAIVNNYPEVGDLLITIEDINGNAIGTLTCQKSWVSGLDIKDTSANQRVALKVMMTAETTGAAAN